MVEEEEQDREQRNKEECRRKNRLHFSSRPSRSCVAVQHDGGKSRRKYTLGLSRHSWLPCDAVEKDEGREEEEPASLHHPSRGDDDKHDNDQSKFMG